MQCKLKQQWASQVAITVLYSTHTNCFGAIRHGEVTATNQAKWNPCMFSDLEIEMILQGGAGNVAAL